MSLDVLCFIAVEFRGHCCFGIFSFIFLCCSECLCSSVQSEIADGFKRKWMLQQTCQREKNDVWESETMVLRGLLCDKSFFGCKGENKLKGNEDIYGVV